MEAVPLLQFGSIFLLNVCFSWLTGSLFARFWLSAGNVSHREATDRVLQTSELVAAVLAVMAGCSVMWASAATMSGESLTEAGGMLWMMLSKTTFGQFGLFGLACLSLILVLSSIKHRRRGHDLAIAGLLICFALSRALVSHAGENGMLSLGLAVEWLHLILVAVWIGGVAVAGWVVLPRSNHGGQIGESMSPYLASLSNAATVALAGILASGAYNAWYRVGSVDNLLGNPYGAALIVKLVLVALTIALGGFNKFVGFPGFARDQRQGMAIAVLRIESLLLLSALMAAAVLASQQPPTSN